MILRRKSALLTTVSDVTVIYGTSKSAALAVAVRLSLALGVYSYRTG
jgi:hypothetical protein